MRIRDPHALPGIRGRASCLTGATGSAGGGKSLPESCRREDSGDRLLANGHARSRRSPRLGSSRSTELCPRTSRAGSPGGKPPSGPCRDTSRTSSAAISSAGSSASATDGVFVPAAAEAGTDAPPAFLPARPITQADLAALTERVRRRVIRWFRMQRLLDAAAAADMLAWENSGFSIDAFRPDHTSRPRCAQLLSESRTSSGPAAAGSPRGREPMASSNSRRLSFSILWRTSSRRRGSTGIATTGCLRRITSSGPPSRRMRKGNIGKRREAVTGGHAAGGRAMGAVVTRIRIKSPARTTRHGLPGRNSWLGWGRSFRSSARGAVAISG